MIYPHPNARGCREACLTGAEGGDELTNQPKRHSIKAVQQ